ncbi:MAG: hypothetical protein ACI376_06445, partial [Candidatus Bruticola sp.]
LVDKEPFSMLAELGFQVEYRSLSVPGVWVRGRTEYAQRRVYIDTEALEVLAARCRRSLSVPVSADLLQRITAAHELFHILAFKAGQSHTELAAVIFSLYFFSR